MPRRRAESIPVWHRLLWTHAQLAGLLGITSRRLKSLRESEQVIRPVIFDGRPFFRAREVQAWVDAGFPTPAAWRWPPPVFENPKPNGAPRVNDE